MLEIDKKKEINLVDIFGEKNYQKWLKSYSVLKNEDILSWLRDKIDKFTTKGKNPSKFSITTYLKPLEQYCLFNEVNNPSDLLKEKIDIRNLRVKKYLMFLLNAEENNQLEKLKELGFKKIPNKVSIKNMHQSRIKSFYSDRGKPISFGIETEKSGENKEEIHLSKEQIQKIKAKFNSPEYRLACKFQTQVGLRISDVLEEIPRYNIEKFKNHFFIRNFYSMKYAISINYLFFTEELSTLLKSIYGIDDLKKLDLSTILKSKRGNIIDKDNYLKRIKQIVKEIGIEGNIKTHAFRKFFSSQVRKCSKIDVEFKEHLMGHTSFNLSQAYNNNLKDIEWFYNEWLKVEKFICVDYTVVKRTNKDILKLKKENVKQQDQIELLLKEKLEFEKNIKQMKQDISNVKDKNSIEDFTNSLLKNLEKYENGEFMQITEKQNTKDFNLDILTSFLVKRIFDIANNSNRINSNK